MIGNTESQSSRKKQPIQCYRWCFTLNNYLEEDILMLRLKLNRLCKKYVFQEETGEEGTRHLQGSISLKTKQRLSNMKEIDNRMHWEATRNVTCADAYCCKEETRSGEVYKWERVKLFKRTSTKFDNLKPRKDIMKIVSKEPDNRTINWIWSEKGKVGKTSTASFLERNYEGVCVANGKGADIKMSVINHLETNDLDVLIVNVPRQNQGYVNYGVLEEIKDGLIYSGKYEGGFANIEYPHVIVLANFEPELDMMSEDRWNVVNVD
jgi:hypothetical protein